MVIEEALVLYSLSLLEPPSSKAHALLTSLALHGFQCANEKSIRTTAS